MYEIAWKEITARGRIVCKRKAFRSECARETYIDQLIQKDSFYEIIGLRDPLWSRGGGSAPNCSPGECASTPRVILTFCPIRVIYVTPA